MGHWLTQEGGRRLVAWSNKPVLPDDDDGAGYLVTTGLDLTEHVGDRRQRGAPARLSS